MRKTAKGTAKAPVKGPAKAPVKAPAGRVVAHVAPAKATAKVDAKPAAKVDAKPAAKAAAAPAAKRVQGEKPYPANHPAAPAAKAPAAAAKPAAAAPASEAPKPKVLTINMLEEAIKVAIGEIDKTLDRYEDQVSRLVEMEVIADCMKSGLDSSAAIQVMERRNAARQKRAATRDKSQQQKSA